MSLRAAAYSSGDPAPLRAITAQTGAATFFPPSGGVVCGAKAVSAEYDTGAKAFAPGARNSLERAGSDLAFWTGLQHFEGQFRGKPAKLKLRITEVFRLTGGEWRLVHRHADPAADPQSRLASRPDIRWSWVATTRLESYGDGPRNIEAVTTTA